MEALTELCDLVAQNPTLFADKLSWICSRCPPPSAPRLTRAHLNSLLTLARFLSKCSSSPPTSRPPLLDFLRSPPLRPSLWPQSYSLDSVACFFSDLFKYVSAACVVSADLASELQSFFGKSLIAAAQQCFSSASDAAAAGIAKVFLSAAARNCPPISTEDAEKAAMCLLAGIGIGDVIESSSSSGSSDSKGKGKEEMDDGSSEAAAKENGNVEHSENGSSATTTTSQSQQQNVFDETVESLEWLEIVFRIVGQVLDRDDGNAKSENLEQVKKLAASQLKSLPAFLKVMIVTFIFLSCLDFISLELQGLK